jgi:2,4-dienoyl-CoA reductase-like NADH-dependent reductase (Old Yellow Enzyme family)
VVSELEQFQTNRRTDVYSSNSPNALNFLRRIVTSIRKVVPADFILGVKLNASDYVDASADQVRHANAPDDDQDPRKRIESQKTEQESRALEHVRVMASWRMVDFIEVSGGDYETPGKFLGL